MKAPDAVIAELLQQVRGWLYSALPERAWFTQQERVKRALTLPAAWLDERKVEVSAERYQEILQGILATIKAKGRKPGQMGKFPCAYLHACVKSHLDHHGEKYYDEGKGIRNRLKLAMPELEKAQIGADGTVPVLAQVHNALASRRRKGKVKSVTEQPGLF